MARFRRVRWIAVIVLAVTATLTFVVGARAFADRGQVACQPVAHAAQVADSHSWRTNGFRAAGCRAWRHMRHHNLLARSR
jgi:hypothetical protein